jgi:hypothetical protein
MAYILFNGAELNSSTAGMEAISVNGTIAPSTTQKRSGSYAWRANPTAGIGWIAQELYDSNVQTVSRHLFWIRVATMPDQSTMIWSLATTSDAIVANITMTTGGVLQFRNGANVAATQLGSDSSALSTNTWYAVYVEFDCTTLASSAFSAKIDDVTWTSATGFTANNAVGRVLVGVQTAATTADIYYDDIVASDNSETIDYLTRVVHLQPAADADTSQRGTQGTDWEPFHLLAEMLGSS